MNPAPGLTWTSPGWARRRCSGLDWAGAGQGGAVLGWTGLELSWASEAGWFKAEQGREITEGYSRLFFARVFEIDFPLMLGPF